MAEGAAGPSVAVAGAGPAGMSAAFALARAGVGVTVFEAADHVGGRTWTDDASISQKRDAPPRSASTSSDIPCRASAW
ncbi:MAG TPA: FAD-dependent oxidoreductase [Longimicrobium sp.]|nr:FAD-dependent oxidoreductase [Longimicrobium sp.]